MKVFLLPEFKIRKNSEVSCKICITFNEGEVKVTAGNCLRI